MSRRITAFSAILLAAALLLGVAAFVWLNGAGSAGAETTVEPIDIYMDDDPWVWSSAALDSPPEEKTLVFENYNGDESLDDRMVEFTRRVLGSWSTGCSIVLRTAHDDIPALFGYPDMSYSEFKEKFNAVQDGVKSMWDAISKRIWTKVRQRVGDKYADYTGLYIWWENGFTSSYQEGGTSYDYSQYTMMLSPRYGGYRDSVAE